MMSPYYAHSSQKPDGTPQPPAKWELLYTGNGKGHLEKVARLAESFAAEFGAAEWGRLAGFWHDLGKYSDSFQAYLHKENGLDAQLEQYKGRVDHSTAGAQHAHQAVQSGGRLLAYAIAGHHAGLTDAAGGRSSLHERLQRRVEPTPAVPPEVLDAVTDLKWPDLSIDAADETRASFQIAFFTRMIFSCLVDADFLATESFIDPAQSVHRASFTSIFREMQTVLNETLQRLGDNAADNEIGKRRQDVLAACRVKARETQGLFTLTVPTGGGKTLASLAFAIEHALRNDLKRVIYAIPFTSIIEQTADVFRGVFETLGHNIVLEHHSNVDPEAEQETVSSRLAAENWDAPLIVTTNVQFFESLFAARTSCCRKLHNVVGSVIILDEAQTLPVELLRPCLAALDELATDYRCSIVLCTATQPALDHSEDFPIGLSGVREIMPEPERLYQQMKRVNVKCMGLTADQDLVARLAGEHSFLAIVNTRSHAARIFEAIQETLGGEPAEGLFHLSTYLCGKHRSHRIDTIRRRLARGVPCKVVSTQLVEAGVDVDFPVVYRSLAGIDSIAQAAGRCNREGRRESGTVWVFEPSDVKLPTYLASVAASAREVMPDFDDLLDPSAVTRYFELHYWKQAGENRWDGRCVMNCFPTPVQRLAFDFRTAAEQFRMIENITKAIFVPYGAEGEELTERLRNDGPSRRLLRRLQRYAVGVYERDYFAMVGSDVEELPGGYAVLINGDIYDEQLGLRMDRFGYHDPVSLIG